MRSMIICSCNRITEKELRGVARAGATTPEKAYACFGCEMQCGCCLDYAEEVIAEERTTRAPLRLVSSRAA